MFEAAATGAVNQLAVAVIRLLSLAALLCIGVEARAAAREFVFVEVLSGGKVCLVQKQEGNCDDIVARVARARESLPGAGITVSPRACGEEAMAEARAIAERLRMAGFTGVFVLGSHQDANSSCKS